MIPYEQLVEAIARWKTGAQATDVDEHVSREPTNGQPAEGLVPDEVVEADAVVTEVTEVPEEEELGDEAAEVVEPDPE